MDRKIFDIQPGPWGIGASKKGGTEISFDEVNLLDKSGDRPKFTLPNGEIIELPDGIGTININRIKDVFPKPKPSEVVVEGNVTGNPFIKKESDGDASNPILEILSPRHQITEMLVKGKVIYGDKSWQLVRDADTREPVRLGKYYVYKEVDQLQ